MGNANCRPAGLRVQRLKAAATEVVLLGGRYHTSTVIQGWRMRQTVSATFAGMSGSMITWPS